jgi:hypothetical protein
MAGCRRDDDWLLSRCLQRVYLDSACKRHLTRFDGWGTHAQTVDAEAFDAERQGFQSRVRVASPPGREHGSET